MEYIEKGVLCKDRFTSKHFHLADIDGAREEDSPPDFDWKDEKHIIKLNQWLSQVCLRITGEMDRPEPVAWTEEERSFLYDLHEERLEKLKADNPAKEEHELLKVRYGAVCMTDFTRRLNEKFPRKTPRKAKTVDAMRKRIPAIIKRFGLRPDKQWLKNNPAALGGEEEAMEGPDESTMFFPEDEGEEEQVAVGGSAKKRTRGEAELSGSD